MKVKNTVIFAGDATLKNRHNEVVKDKTDKQEDKKSIFAGGLNKKLDPIEAKRKEAQKQALKVVSDAWNSEQQIDKQIRESKERIAEHHRTMSEMSKKLDAIAEGRAALRRNYGIEENSQEEMDLQLLEKREAAEKLGSRITLTKDDREQLARIDEAGLTQYQKHSMEMLAGGEAYEEAMRAAQQGIEIENATIAAIRKEMLKSATMFKAQKGADEIMQDANDQIVGMLINEAKKHVDEEFEEELDAAREKAEKKEEEEEKAEKAEDNTTKQEKVQDEQKKNADVTESLLELGSSVQEVQKEVKKIMEEMKITQEELKGAVVDALN